MNVRITYLGEHQVVVDGAAADPPEVGKVFSLLVMSQERLYVTGEVARVELDTFWTVNGARYSWARSVGDA